MEDRYYHTKESVAQYLKMSEGIDGQEHIDELKQHLPEGAALLEIGTGPGKDWSILSRSYEVTGSDNSEEFLSHLKASYPQGDFLHLDAATLETDQSFDGIYSNKVLHHLTDHELSQCIENQARLLKSGGIACHTFWKGEGSETFKGMFVNYHTKADVESYFDDPFEVIKLRLYAEFEKDDSLLLIVRKK